MNAGGGTLVVLMCLGFAYVVVRYLGKPTVTAVSGIFTRDKKGRLVLVLSPAKRKKGKRKKGKR